MNIMNMPNTPRLIGLLAGALCLATACQRDPNVRANEFLASADAYLAHGQLNEAIIEYRRAVQLVPGRTDVHLKLAKAYSDAHDGANAYVEYARAADLDPSQIDAQIQAGTLLLLAGDFQHARARAESAIASDPRDVHAHILLGNALAGLKDTAQAMRQMEQAVALDPASPDAYAALGSVQFAANNPRASASFEKAVALQPKSIDARLALANYHWASGSRTAAERDLKTALEIDATNSDLHRALALLYLVDGRTSEAEPHFKALAAQSAPGRLALADFYSGLGRLEEARKILEPLGTDQRIGRIARLRLAFTLRQQGHRDEALRMADGLIHERPNDADAHTLKARLLLSPPQDSAAAWTEAQKAVKADPGSAPAQYTLGLAAAARNDADGAEAAFRETLKINPRASSAELQLAKIRLARGDAASALTSAEGAARANPQDPDAALVLARSLRARGDFDRARRELASRLQTRPDAVALRIELGWNDLQSGRIDEARAAFDRALASDPKNEEARAGAVATDIASHDFPKARTRLAGWRGAGSGDTALEVLAARVDLASQDSSSAEQRLLNVIRKEPARLDAYELLAGSYLKRGELPAALEKYRALAALSPDAVGPATMVGMLLEQLGDRAGARAQYEAVLSRHPHAAIAANNLAWMLAEASRYDEALRWAHVAVDTLRDRPEPADTLGWIYLKTNNPIDARASFQKALDLSPQTPIYQQHLDEAKKALGLRR